MRRAPRSVARDSAVTAPPLPPVGIAAYLRSVGAK
jgi:hypothetical protein